jgi:hypothetical protein
MNRTNREMRPISRHRRTTKKQIDKKHVKFKKMNWIAEINNEFRDVLKQGRHKGEVYLSEDQIHNAELNFVPYTNIRNEKRVFISPPVIIIDHISENLYKRIRKIYPKYNQDISRHFGLN